MVTTMTAQEKTVEDLDHAMFHDEHGVKPRVRNLESRVENIETLMKQERDNRSRLNWLIVANLLTVAGIVFKVWWEG